MKSNKEQIITMLAVLGEYFSFEFTGARGKGYVLGLEDYTGVDWGLVTKHIIKTCDKMPSVTDIIKIIDPKLDEALSPKQKGIELVTEVKQAIQKHGWNNWDDAQKVLSERALALIRNCGGWAKTCSMDFTDAALYAQVRDSAEVIATKEDFNELDYKEALSMNKDLDELVKKLVVKEPIIKIDANS